MDTLTYARYPFLRDASEWLKDSGVTLEDLLTNDAYHSARVRGRARAMDALESGSVASRPMATVEDRLEEVLSYPMARILVSCVADKFLIKRYALAEGEAMRARLEKDPEDVVEEVSYQLGVRASAGGQDGVVRMHFSDFLRLTSHMRSKEWKLVNQDVHAGQVTLARTKYARVLQQALQDRIEDELPLPVNDAIRKAVAGDVKDLGQRTALLRERYRAEDFGKVEIANFPPCINRLIGMAQAGENLPHTGRFAMVAFLHHVGLSADEVLALFSSSPDFDASKSRYQVEHISGVTSGTEYSPPECSTMKSNGLCYEPDRLCVNKYGDIRHPLTYYRVKCRPKPSAAPKESPPPTEGPASRS